MEIVTAIGSKLGEYFVEATIHQARYLFCFNSIVEDLKKEEEELKCQHDSIKKEVEREHKNTKEIAKVVEKWLKDVDFVIKDVEKLKEEIPVNQSCLNGWCPNWGCRYWLGRKATKKTVIMSKLIDKGGKFNINTVGHLKPLPGIEFSTSRDFMSFKATKMACDHLIKALTNEKTKMVGLYGTGGAGKTTLAKVTGLNLQQQKIFDEVLMVVVSQNPNFINIQNQLAGSLDLEFQEVIKEDRAKRLHVRFTQTKSKILVILDDVWQRFDLKTELGIPIDDNHNGCKILLTTRREDVCEKMDCDPRIRLGILEPEEGLALLKKYAGIDDNDSTLIGVSKEVAGECKGLPLAIAAVGSALKGKKKDADWNMVSWKLRNSKLNDLDDIEGERDVYSCIKLSYDYLKDDQAKLCFLFCSLYPEDHVIELEDLVRYGLGLGWYQDVKTIEETRSILRGTIEWLKASSLLLDTGNEEFVKLHDVVRDVAIWIGSKEKIFMTKVGVGLTKWPEDEALEQYRAISLLGNNIKVLPNGLVFPNLDILLLEGDGEKLVVPDQFFEGMTGLKIVTIMNGKLSLKSLRYSTKLRVLHLIYCRVGNVGFLGELERLQLLCLKGSICDEKIPEELGYKLRELKLLYVDDYTSPTMIRRFSRLEEFYGIIKNWEVEGMCSKRSHENIECLSKDFTYPKLQRYFISNAKYQDADVTTAHTLIIRGIEASSLVIFSELFQNLQFLHLWDVIGCQNIVPSIDQKGLTELTDLQLENCDDLECILDDSQHVRSQDLVRLSSLSLTNLPKLRWIWKDPAQHLNLKNLMNLRVQECHNLTYLFSLSQARSLVQLESLQVYACERLKCIIEGKFDGNEREKHILGEDENTIVLPMLRKVKMERLPNLITFCSEKYYSTWPTLLRQPSLMHVNLKNLTNLDVRRCHNLTYLFSLSQARSLVQLESLEVDDCERLKCIVEGKFDGNEREKHMLGEDESTAVLPMLKALTLRDLPNLICLCSKNYYSTWPTLQQLILRECPLLTSDELVNLKNLTNLRVDECDNLTYLFSLSQARSLVQLESLKVFDCERLQCIIEGTFDGNEREKHILGLDENTIVLPMLRKVKVKRLPNLITFRSENYYSTWPSLQELILVMCPLLTSVEHVNLKNLTNLDVRECHNLTYIFSLSQARGLVQLESLKVDNCQRLKCIIEGKFDGNDRGKHVLGEDENTIVLPMLKELTLQYLPHLISFCSEKYYSKWPTLQKLILWECPLLSSDEHVNLKNLTNLDVNGCHNLTYLFSLSQAQSFVQLESLKVFDCERLKCIIEGTFDGNEREKHILGEDEKTIVLPMLRKITLERLPNLMSFCSKKYYSTWPTLQELILRECPLLTSDEHVNLKNLMNLLVEKCHNLAYLFSLSQARSLVQLESLKVFDCERLKCIIEGKFDGNDREKHILGEDEKTNVLPMLKELTLLCLPNLISFCSVKYYSTWPTLQKLILWECPLLTSDEHVNLKNLTNLFVEKCHNLTYLFSLSQARSLVQLESLKVFDCKRLKCIIEGKFDCNDREKHIHGEDEKAIVLPMLRIIALERLPNLIGFCSEENYSTWPTLQKLILRECPLLTSDELVNLKNLTNLIVNGCHNLTYLFSLSQAQSLAQLKSLVVDDCEGLKCIIEGTFDGNEREKHILREYESTTVLPMLKVLTLRDLPNLICFYSKNYYSTWPTLQELILEKCPLLTISDEFTASALSLV